jgi:hypothetical protein
MNPLRREDFAAKVSIVLKGQGFYYLRCWSDKQEYESEGTPYRISKDAIYRIFSKFFDVGEISICLATIFVILSCSNHITVVLGDLSTNSIATATSGMRKNRKGASSMIFTAP